MTYARAFFVLQLRFAETVSALSGLPLARALLEYINLYCGAPTCPADWPCDWPCSGGYERAPAAWDRPAKCVKWLRGATRQYPLV